MSESEIENTDQCEANPRDYADAGDAVMVIDTESAAPQGQPCDACGAPVEPLDHFCPACGCPNPAYKPPAAGAADAAAASATTTSTAATEAVVDAEPAPAAAKSPTPPTPPPPSQKHFRCENCGSEVATDPDQRSYVCPFCDSTYVVEFSPELSGRQPPEFVIGFAVTPKQAQEKFRHWIADNRWFRPGDLRSAQIADKLKGVYLPFWSFSMLAESEWDATIGEYWYRTVTYTTRDSKGRTVTRTRRVRETEWWPLAGRHHRFYAGYLVSGSKGLSQADADRIQPFQLPALRRYEPFFLAGWLCEEYSVPRNDALQICQHEFYRREQSNVTAFLPGDTSRNVQVRTHFSRVNSDLCLLPIYILSYRYKDKLYRFLVNGQTGRVDGDKPVSWAKIGIAIAVGVGLIAVVGLAVALLSQM